MGGSIEETGAETSRSPEDRPAGLAQRTGEALVKSRRRVADHGEVFTPAWLVEAMLDLVKGESERIDARFLEPACGSGNFLVPVLRRKLATVHERFGRSDFEKRHHALLALMCIYGIELLPDNAAECRVNLLHTLFDYLGKGVGDEWFGAAQVVVEANIVQGNALDMTTSTGEAIMFPEWGYLGKGRFQRRDFRFDTLTQRSSIEGTLFAELEEHDVFIPTRTYPSMTVVEIAR
ncbi:MAG: N-6 DNA methylase [Actinomycetota bacterium]|nr:MAG: N-6 DNA methylase [Actinomycetota bacterium]